MTDPDPIDEQIADLRRLSGRIDALMMQRNPPEYARQMYDNSAQITRHEHALFGVTGNNGLTSKVRDLSQGLLDLHTVIQSMRDEEFGDVKQALADTKTSVRRWAIGLGVPLLVALISALTMIYVSGLHHH